MKQGPYFNLQMFVGIQRDAADLWDKSIGWVYDTGCSLSKMEFRFSRLVSGALRIVNVEVIPEEGFCDAPEIVWLKRGRADRTSNFCCVPFWR